MGGFLRQIMRGVPDAPSGWSGGAHDQGLRSRLSLYPLPPTSRPRSSWSNGYSRPSRESLRCRTYSPLLTEQGRVALRGTRTRGWVLPLGTNRSCLSTPLCAPVQLLDARTLPRPMRLHHVPLSMAWSTWPSAPLIIYYRTLYPRT